MFSSLEIYSTFSVNKILFDGSQYIELEIELHTSLVLVSLSNQKFFTCKFQGEEEQEHCTPLRY